MRTGNSIGITGSARTGHFWFVQKPGAPPRLVGHGVALADGERYGDYINYPGEHLRYWPDAKPYLPAFFHDHGHKDWPRGRVLYNTKTQTFEVYLNEQLRTPTFEAEILAYFNLPEAITLFACDPHYSEARFELGPAGPQ
jgi:hypothetical protein